MPADIGALAAGETIHLRAKSNGTSLGAGDVFEVRFGGGGGYGDPLLRSPDQVARDLAQGTISAQTAAEVYGVVLTASGGVDEAATESRRASRRQSRAGWNPVCPAGDTPAAARHGGQGQAERGPNQPGGGGQATGEQGVSGSARAVHGHVVATTQGGEHVLACGRCGHRFCDYGGAYKSGTLVEVSPVTAIPTAPDPGTFLDRPFVFRRYCCPGCQLQVATEIAPADEAPYPEMRLGRHGAAAAAHA